MRYNIGMNKNTSPTPSLIARISAIHVNDVPIWIIAPCILAFFAIVFVSRIGPDIPSSEARLKADGYTRIAVANGPASMCPRATPYGHDFTAIDAKERRVAGSLCGTYMAPNTTTFYNYQ